MNATKLLCQIVKNYNDFHTHVNLSLELLDSGDLLLTGCEHAFGFVIPLLESLKFHTISIYIIEDPNNIRIVLN